MSSVDWFPAVTFLAAGLAVGGFVLWLIGRKGGAAPAEPRSAAPLALRDLEGKYEALLGQLRELDAVAVKRTPEQIRAERHALEHAAALALQEIDRHAQTAPASKKKSQPEAAAPPPAPAAPAPANPALRGFLWGVGSVGALGLLFFFVSQSAKQRAPGGSVTGNLPMEAAQGGDDAELAEARARADRNPNDVDARLDLARHLLMRQDMMAVFNETQAVLKLSPGQPRALSYQALVRLAMGQTAKAESMLKEALQKDPDLIDGYLHLMLVYVRSDRPAEAEKVLAEAKRRFPARAESLQGLLAEMRAQGAEDAQAVDAADPHAEVAVGGAAPKGAAAAPAAGAKKVTGLLELDASLQGERFSGAIVFVTLREGGFGAGPPLAARRIPAGSFPMPFEIGSADSMTGEPLPDDLLVEARIDSDGDPITRPPSDPYGRADRVPAGSKDVKVVLKRKPQS